MRSTLLPRAMLVVTVLALLLPAQAGAQIYTWRDAAGNLVLSNTPRAGASVTYAVPHAAQSIRATRPATSARAKQYEPLILEHATAHAVRPDLVRAVIQAESAFNRFARSPKGAMGLMQLMPATAAELGVTDPYDPEQNIRGGVAYLRSLLTKYDHNEELALAAYNAGPGAVEKYGAVPPYRETRNYIERIREQADVSQTSAARTVVRTVEIVDGREVTRFVTGKPLPPTAPSKRASNR